MDWKIISKFLFFHFINYRSNWKILNTINSDFHILRQKGMTFKQFRFGVSYLTHYSKFPPVFKYISEKNNYDFFAHILMLETWIFFLYSKCEKQDYTESNWFEVLLTRTYNHRTLTTINFDLKSCHSRKFSEDFRKKM